MIDTRTRVAVVGSRDFPDLDLVTRIVGALDPQRHVIVSGGARGVDQVAESVARARGFGLVVYPAEWDKYGKSAGMIRNADIVKDCAVVLAFWDGESRGTANTIRIAESRGKAVLVFKRAQGGIGGGK